MFTDVTDLCDSEAEDGDLDLESTAFSDNTDFAERTLRTQGDVPQALGTVVCQTDLRRRLQGERHLVKQGGSTASAHLQGKCERDRGGRWVSANRARGWGESREERRSVADRCSRVRAN